MEQREESHLRHLFDGEPVLNVYNDEIVNLSVGAPGPDLLKLCAPKMRRATEHRLVAIEASIIFYTVSHRINFNFVFYSLDTYSEHNSDHR